MLQFSLMLKNQTKKSFYSNPNYKDDGNVPARSNHIISRCETIFYQGIVGEVNVYNLSAPPVPLYMYLMQGHQVPCHEMF